MQVITQLVLLNKGHECYDTLSKAFAVPFCEINTLLDVGFNQVLDNRYLVSSFLEGT